MGMIARILDLLKPGQAVSLPEIAVQLHERLAEADPAVSLGLNTRQRAGYDRLMDALNRLPRPVMAMGTLALIAAGLVAPEWFAGRMEALATMPEALWWLIGAVISLYFGARYQAHDQAFQRELLEAVVLTGPTAPAPAAGTPQVAATGTDAALALAALRPAGNPALAGIIRPAD